MGTEAAPRHKTGTTAMRGLVWLLWRIDLARHSPHFGPQRGSRRRLKVGKKARCLKTGGLPRFLDDGQIPPHDTVQLWYVRRGEFLPDAAIVGQLPERSTTGLPPQRQIGRTRQLMVSCCRECRRGTT